VSICVFSQHANLLDFLATGQRKPRDLKLDEVAEKSPQQQLKVTRQ
jgi:hypothetical protein